MPVIFQTSDVLSVTLRINCMENTENVLGDVKNDKMVGVVSQYVKP